MKHTQLILIIWAILGLVNLQAQEIYTKNNAANPTSEGNNTSGWVIGSGAEITSSTEEAFVGNSSIKIKGTIDGWRLAQYTFTTQVDVEYTIKIRVKADNNADAAGFWVWNGFYSFGLGQAISRGSNWTLHTFNLTANATTATIKAYVDSPGGLSGGTLYLDDISIYPTNNPPSVPTTEGGSSLWNANGNNISYNNGKVSIGTSDTQYALNVEGTTAVTSVLRVQRDGAYRVALNGAADGYIVGRNDSNVLTFNIRSKGTTYFNGGDVGIGTTNTQGYKLAVNGNIRAKEIKVETGWADYVFLKDYTLPTLEEVAQHIKEKGHLINIPSAKEVKANGINLGEMNKLLLEKIEELTLYIIQQDKRIQKLENKK